ncbi:hypothetical protein Q8F55_005393 [Vanrija albida]|uniref:Uncharacterized protein n=1 Tax=Vanrija albida TaxID=181172 RepID=A0ABR3Q1K1_9TREE
MLLLGPTLASLLLTASLAAAQSQSSAEAQPQSSTPTVAPTAAPTYPTGGVITTSVGAFTRDNGTSSDYETRILDTATIKYILANVTVTFPTSSDWWAADARNAWPNIALLGGPLNNVSLPSLPNQYSRYWYTIGWNVTLHNEDTSLLKAPTFLARGGLSQEPFEANLTRRNGNEIGKKQLVDAK